MFTNIAGLPAHPLLVHAAVTLVPIAALLCIVWALIPATHRALRYLAPVVSIISVPAILLARSSGEAMLALKGLSEANMGPVSTHALYANGATASTIALAVLAAAFYYATTTNKARTFAMIVQVLTVVAALATLVFVVLTGHEGARLVWTS
ncbi:DUF2231 domain-containing protein [Corynebacterium tapiri]|uniref:DUF2231 domain-containing protein n=1 Tax=Corynebacterium tapiri TaxID=1448266 RepID=A0A5C4U660_9CORY|nr:DUF2231 domain-containing protein [Corynebacterium tapiri]TNL98724.1 hypothetical protein FHE74_03630 [Corynebacterium tapiri]